MMAFMNIEKKTWVTNFGWGLGSEKSAVLIFLVSFQIAGYLDSNGFLKKKKCSKPIERVCDSDFYIYCFCM